MTKAAVSLTEMGWTGPSKAGGRLALTFVLIVAALNVVLSSASAKVTLPTVPTCSKFSTGKISSLLGVGRLHLVHTLVHGTSCTYYGVSAAQANALATKSVPYQQIKYVPSLMITIEPTTKALFDLQKGLLSRSASSHELEFGAVSAKLRLGSEEYFYSGDQTSQGEQPCESEIMYDNWLGPPSCVGEPPLRKVGVLAWIGGSSGIGRMVNLAASAQGAGGTHLSLSHLLELAKESTTGALY
jgi:hypothetical protein